MMQQETEKNKVEAGKLPAAEALNLSEKREQTRRSSLLFSSQAVEVT